MNELTPCKRNPVSQPGRVLVLVWLFHTHGRNEMKFVATTAAGKRSTVYADSVDEAQHKVERKFGPTVADEAYDRWEYWDGEWYYSVHSRDGGELYCVTLRIEGMQRVCVYGTLRRGGALHGHMKRIGARYYRTTRINGFRMYTCGAYPALVPSDDDQRVAVEVYAVDIAGLLHLDRVEGVDGGLYSRKLIRVGSEECWIYYRDDCSGWGDVPSGDWITHCNEVGA